MTKETKLTATEKRYGQGSPRGNLRQRGQGQFQMESGDVEDVPGCRVPIPMIAALAQHNSLTNEHLS